MSKNITIIRDGVSYSGSSEDLRRLFNIGYSSLNISNSENPTKKNGRGKNKSPSDNVYLAINIKQNGPVYLVECIKEIIKELESKDELSPLALEATIVSQMLSPQSKIKKEFAKQAGANTFAEVSSDVSAIYCGITNNIKSRLTKHFAASNTTGLVARLKSNRISPWTQEDTKLEVLLIAKSQAEAVAYECLITKALSTCGFKMISKAR